MFIAAPNASDERIRAIASRSRGYVYVTTRPGVTGAETAGLRDDAARVITRLREMGSSRPAPPPLLGFGIGRPEHVQEAIAMGAAGAISGSAIATRIAKYDGRSGRAAMLSEIGEFVRTMKRATLPRDTDGG